MFPLPKSIEEHVRAFPTQRARAYFVSVASTLTQIVDYLPGRTSLIFVPGTGAGAYYLGPSPNLDQSFTAPFPQTAYPFSFNWSNHPALCTSAWYAMISGPGTLQFYVIEGYVENYETIIQERPDQEHRDDGYLAAWLQQAAQAGDNRRANGQPNYPQFRWGRSAGQRNKRVPRHRAF